MSQNKILSFFGYEFQLFVYITTLTYCVTTSPRVWAGS